LLGGLFLAAHGDVAAAEQDAMFRPGTASISPVVLPRDERAPATLRFGFRSPRAEGEVPELERLSLGASAAVAFSTRWPQRCSLAMLYARKRDPRAECATALIGHGSVTSEIALPGQDPVTVTGHLLAFYAYARGTPRILAQVTTGEPLPLVYVIPFEIEAEPNGTSLTVSRARMREIAGVCAPGHPYCFGPSPYTLEGAYSRIEALSISLHRVVRRHGSRFAFVSARCPLPPGIPIGPGIRLSISLTHADGEASNRAIPKNCQAT
jgi:hypothetical protein